jgi:hypothetical protein
MPEQGSEDSLIKNMHDPVSENNSSRFQAAIKDRIQSQISGRQTPGLTRGSPSLYITNAGGWTPG